MLFLDIKKKLHKIFIASILLFAAVVAKMGYTQIFSYSYIVNKAEELWKRSFPIEANRGDIVDRNGKIIATSMSTASVVVIPAQIVEPENTAKLVAEILGVDYEKIYNKITKRVSIERIQPEGRQISQEKADKIAELKLSGVYLVKDSLRYYPNGNLLSHTLGFVGMDNQGLAGLELKYNDYLMGESGNLHYYMDAKGNLLPTIASEYEAPADGMTLQLTIDYDIQAIVERELNNAMIKYRLDSIYAIAMDPRNGEILAISSKPDYNPNEYQIANPDVYNRNLAVWKNYEPGSVFKLVSFSAGLEEGLYDMYNDKYFDRGYEYVGRARIKSWKKGGHGLQTFMEVLQNSSNPGFVEISRRLGTERLRNYVLNFGFGSKTGVDIVGEATGIMFSEEQMGPVETATVAFGQGVSVTAIQMMAAVGAIVNGGTLYQPHIAKGLINSITGEVVQEIKPTEVRQVISAETSALMRDAMEHVVALGGSRNAYIDGYRIGGKTGTAQKVENGVYKSGEYILSFLGVAPIDDPQFIIYVIADGAKGISQYGATVAAPVGKAILEDVLPLLGVENTTNQIPKTYSWTDPEKYQVENYENRLVSEVKSGVHKFEYVGEGDRVISQLPEAGTYLAQGDTVVLFLSDGGEFD